MSQMNALKKYKKPTQQSANDTKNGNHTILYMYVHKCVVGYVCFLSVNILAFCPSAGGFYVKIYPRPASGLPV